MDRQQFFRRQERRRRIRRAILWPVDVFWNVWIRFTFAAFRFRGAPGWRESTIGILLTPSLGVAAAIIVATLNLQLFSIMLLLPVASYLLGIPLAYYPISIGLFLPQRLARWSLVAQLLSVLLGCMIGGIVHPIILLVTLFKR